MKKNLIAFALCACFSSQLQAQLQVEVEKQPVVTESASSTNPEQESIEQTLALIKPDAVENQYIGEIISRYEEAGFEIVGIKMVRLSKERAEKFYAEHKERPFFNDLTTYMSSGPIVAVVLEGRGAIKRNRNLMGATDPSKAEKGSLRAAFGESMTRNAVHGSDSSQAANREIDFFFASDEDSPAKK